jgi:hypothetical protein
VLVGLGSALAVLVLAGLAGGGAYALWLRAGRQSTTAPAASPSPASSRPTRAPSTPVGPTSATESGQTSPTAAAVGTCILGRPNSGDTTVVVLTGPGADSVCNDLTNPLRRSAELQGRSVLSTHPARYRICQFQRSGLEWSVFDTINSPVPGPGGDKTPGGGLC